MKFDLANFADNYLPEDPHQISAREKGEELGALDAIEYYDQVDGDFDALKKSYEWEWLATYAFMKRSLTPAQ